MTIQNNRLNGINPLSYLGVNATQPPQIITANVAPNNQQTHFPLGTIWINGVGASALIYMFVGINPTTGLPIWPLIAEGTGGDILTLSDTAALQVHPDGGGNIQLVGDATSGINVVSTPGSHLLTVSNANRVNGTAQTIGATTATLISVAVANNRSVTATVNISGARSDYSAGYAANGFAGYTQQAGVLTILPNVVINSTWTNGLAPTIIASLTTSGTNIILQVTGEAAHTWNWSASAEITIVSA